MSFRKDQFNVINNYFIGPKGSNLPDFRANINTILDELLEARLNYYPEDNVLFPPLYRLRYNSANIRTGTEVHQQRDPSDR